MHPIQALKQQAVSVIFTVRTTMHPAQEFSGDIIYLRDSIVDVRRQPRALCSWSDTT